MVLIVKGDKDLWREVCNQTPWAYAHVEGAREVHRGRSRLERSFLCKRNTIDRQAQRNIKVGATAAAHLQVGQSTLFRIRWAQQHNQRYDRRQY